MHVDYKDLTNGRAVLVMHDGNTVLQFEKMQEFWATFTSGFTEITGEELRDYVTEDEMNSLLEHLRNKGFEIIDNRE